MPYSTRETYPDSRKDKPAQGGLRMRGRLREKVYAKLRGSPQIAVSHRQKYKQIFINQIFRQKNWCDVFCRQNQLVIFRRNLIKKRQAVKTAPAGAPCRSIRLPFRTAANISNKPNIAKWLTEKLLFQVNHCINPHPLMENWEGSLLLYGI